MQSGEEKSRRPVRTGLARCRWVLSRSEGRVGGDLALDVGILTGMFGDIWAWRCHRSELYTRSEERRVKL